MDKVFVIHYSNFDLISWCVFLTICFESLVERDGALRSMTIESEGEKDLWWHALMHKTRYIPEPEFTVVIRMPYQAAALSFQV